MRTLILSVNFRAYPYPVYPLGAATAAETARRAGHEVRLADLFSEGDFQAFRPERLRALAEEFKPDCVGLSLRNLENMDGEEAEENWDLEIAAQAAAELRGYWDGPVFLGGAGFSLAPAEALARIGADYGLPGEAETALPAFLDKLSAGLARPGLQERPEPAAGPLGPVLDPELIRRYAERGGLIGVPAKRGCPFGCLYCSYPHLEGRSLRFRPTAEVMKDLERLAEILAPAAGGRTPIVAFVDAVFNDPAGRWRELLAALAEARLPLRWTAFFQPLGFAPGDTELIRESGAAGLEFGSDAASDAALAGLAKPFDFETVRRTQADCAKAGLPAAHYVIFGGPGETGATAAEGLANLDRLPGCVVFVSAGLSVYPHTPLFDLARAEGLISDAEPARPVRYYAPGLNPEALRAGLRRALGARRDRLFPPSRAWESLAALRRMGYYGLLWDTLIGAGRRRPRRSNGAPAPGD